MIVFSIPDLFPSRTHRERANARIKIYEEIKDEGRLEVRRADILEAVEVKFGADARAEFAPLLEEVSDSNRLAALLRLALRAKDLTEFRDRFEAP